MKMTNLPAGALIHGATAKAIMDTGRMANSTEKASNRYPTVLSTTVIGTKDSLTAWAAKH